MTGSQRRITRAAWLLASAVAVVLSLMGTSPAIAECSHQRNMWPAFTDVAPTAKRVVIGTVIEGRDQFERGSHVAYVLRIDETLRGSAPASMVITGLRSGLRLIGWEACRSASYLSGRVGDILAIAFRGRLPGIERRVSTAAWIHGRPDPLHVLGAQRLTLREVRLATMRLPPTSSDPSPAPSRPEVTFDAARLARRNDDAGRCRLAPAPRMMARPDQAAAAFLRLRSWRLGKSSLAGEARAYLGFGGSPRWPPPGLSPPPEKLMPPSPFLSAVSQPAVGTVMCLDSETASSPAGPEGTGMTIASNAPGLTAVASVRGIPDASGGRPQSPPVGVVTRVVVPTLGIDLPVISRDERVAGQGPERYPPCGVALYHTAFGQPGDLDTTYLYAHAREGMFLPLLEASEWRNGAELLEQIVRVYTSDKRVHSYRIQRVKRHATDFSLVMAAPAGTEQLILQTSEGPHGTAPKLQVLAEPLAVRDARASEATIGAHAWRCRDG